MLLCVIALLLLLPLISRLVKQVVQAQIREVGQSRRNKARAEGEQPRTTPAKPGDAGDRDDDRVGST